MVVAINNTHFSQNNYKIENGSKKHSQSFQNPQNLLFSSVNDSQYTVICSLVD